MTYRHILLIPFIILFSILGTGLSAQNVVVEDEAYLKEFDLYSFKDAAPKIKDSSVLYMHLIGAKWGYGMQSVSFSQSSNHKGISTMENYGIYYTYLHSMLGTMPYFGIQVGLAKSDYGYTHCTKVAENEFTEQQQIYSAIDFSMVSLFRAEMKKMRLMLGAGGYISYFYDTNLEGGIPATTNKEHFGIMGQGGIAFKMNPFELHLEASYKYGLTNFYDPQIYSKDYWLYTHPSQLQITVGLQYVIGRKYHTKKK